MPLLAALLIGLVFGAGISLAGMDDPSKVLNFFDFAAISNGIAPLAGSPAAAGGGTGWDPSLAFVMGGALVVTAIGYRLVWRRGRPLMDTRFRLPATTVIDRPLVLGSAIFGLGWGLAGFCPGGAIPALGVSLTDAALWQPVVFVATLAAGLAIGRVLKARMSRPPQVASPQCRASTPAR